MATDHRGNPINDNNSAKTNKDRMGLSAFLESSPSAKELTPEEWEEAEEEITRQADIDYQDFALFEQDRDSDMHLRESFGDDYNAYRAHKAGDIDEDEEY